MIHESAWYLTLLAIALIALTIGRISATADTPSTAGTASSAYRWRGPLFWALLVLGVVVSVATLIEWPHRAYAAVGPAVKTIKAAGYQWRWKLSEDTVPVGQPVEFHVTAEDVNHGFGIYRDSKLLAQIQAMPGFTNKLRFTFPAPGEYQILCLEYCGVAHHGMMATVRAIQN